MSPHLGAIRQHFVYAYAYVRLRARAKVKVMCLCLCLCLCLCPHLGAIGQHYGKCVCVCRG